MQFDEAINHLKGHGVPFAVHTHAPNRTMEDVANSQAFDMGRSLKALAFGVREQLVVAVVPGLNRLHYGNLARSLAVSRKLFRVLEPKEVEIVLGDVPGGVSPLQRDGVRVLFDKSVAQLDVVYCGSGRPDRTLELAAPDLLRVTKGELAPLMQQAPALAS